MEFFSNRGSPVLVFDLDTSMVAVLAPPDPDAAAAAAAASAEAELRLGAACR